MRLRLGLGLGSMSSASSVGFNTVAAGQSNVTRYFTVSGEAEFETQAQTYVADATFTNGALGGSGLTQHTNASNYWINQGTDAVTNIYTTTFLAAIDAAYGSRSDVNVVLWGHGESLDSGAEATNENHEAQLRKLFAQMRTDIGSHLQIVIQPLPRRTTGGDDVAAQEVRAAHTAIAADTDYVHMGAETADLTMDADGLHLASASFDTQAVRMAKRSAEALGLASTTTLGPAVSSAELVGDTVIVDLTHNDGSSLSPASSIEGFRILDDASAVAVNEGAVVSPTRVALNLNSIIATGSDIDLDFLYGRVDSETASNLLRDDDGLVAQAINGLSVTETAVATNGLIAPSNQNISTPGGTMEQRTVVIDIDTDGNPPSNYTLFHYDVGTTDARVFITNTGQLRLQHAIAGVLQTGLAYTDYDVLTIGSRQRIVVRWDTDGTYDVWINGVKELGFTGLSTATNAPSTLGVGQSTNAGNQASDSINAFVDISTAQSDEDCLALSAI